VNISAARPDLEAAMLAVPDVRLRLGLHFSLRPRAARDEIFHEFGVVRV
jgi:hypothetical protein